MNNNYYKNIALPQGSDKNSASIHGQMRSGIVSKKSKKRSINNKHYDAYCANPMTQHNIDLSVGT